MVPPGGKFGKTIQVAGVGRDRVAGGAAFEGIVPGTLSFDVARWNHPRSGDILVSANWTRETNDAGFAGKTTQEGVELDVKSITGTATGRGTFDLQKLAITGTLTAELHMDMTSGSDRTPMAMTLELRTH